MKMEFVKVNHRAEWDTAIKAEKMAKIWYEEHEREDIPHVEYEKVDGKWVYYLVYMLNGNQWKEIGKYEFFRKIDAYEEKNSPPRR
jgi:hypothetical protein